VRPYAIDLHPRHCNPLPPPPPPPPPQRRTTGEPPPVHFPAAPTSTGARARKLENYDVADGSLIANKNWPSFAQGF
jgi:hypothetical protein